MLVDVAISRRRVYRPESDPRALSGESGERCSPYSLVSSLAERDIYRDVNAVEDFRLSEEAQAWWQWLATQQKRDRRAMRPVITPPLPLENAGAADGVGCRRRDDAQMAEFQYFILGRRLRKPLLAGGISTRRMRIR